MVFAEMLLGVVVGLLGHSCRWITEQISGGWADMSRYGIGVVSTFPVFYIAQKRHKPEDAYLLSFLFVGMGVLVGYLLDAHKDRYNV